MEPLRPGNYCKVFVNVQGLTLNPLVAGKPGWIEGVVVSVGAKRTRVAVGRNVIQKRNRFVRPV